jgi:hypothetical protein
MTVTHKIRTYDIQHCTSTGYDVEIRDDGRMRITSHTRWSGSRNGVVWMACTPKTVQDAIIAEANGDPDSADVETAVDTYLQTDWEQHARKIRLGYIIQ